MPSGRELIRRLKEEGKVQYASLSKAAGANPAYIQQFIARNVPVELPEEIRFRLAPVLGVNPDDLRESDPPFTSSTSEIRPADDVLIPNFGAMPRDLPVYGTAAGAGSDGAFIINFGDVVDRVRRPPGLTNNRLAYGVYVEGTSMEPAYHHGDLVVVDPARKIRPGDRMVVVIWKGDEKRGEQQAMIKEFVREANGTLHLRQFNPDKNLAFPLDRIVSKHRVLSTAEIMGA